MRVEIPKKERHTGFELLRIVSMIMIVLMHIIGHGGLKDAVTPNMPLYHIYWLIYALSRVSTNCFVMLSGYYMVTSKLKPSRVLRVWCEVLFYSLLTYTIAVKVGCTTVSLSEMIKAFTPIASETFWFATAYLLMYFCAPLLNRVIQGIKTKKEFQRVLFVMLLMTSVLPTVLYWSDAFLVQGGYSYLWFIVLYFIGVYIRLYVDNVNKKACVLIYLGLALTVPATRIVSELIQEKIGATTLVDNMLDYKMPVTLIMSVAFFLIFREIHIKKNILRKLIFSIAPLSFGVYLLHDSEYLRRYLWDTINIKQYAGEWISLVYMLLITIMIVGIGYIVAFLYRKICKLLGITKLEQRLDAFILREDTNE